MEVLEQMLNILFEPFNMTFKIFDLTPYGYTLFIFSNGVLVEIQLYDDLSDLVMASLINFEYACKKVGLNNV